MQPQSTHYMVKNVELNEAAIEIDPPLQCLQAAGGVKLYTWNSSLDNLRPWKLDFYFSLRV